MRKDSPTKRDGLRGMRMAGPTARVNRELKPVATVSIARQINHLIVIMEGGDVEKVQIPP